MSKTTVLYKDTATGAERDASVSAEGHSDFSNIEKLPEGVSPKGAATLENNQWLLGGNFGLLENEETAFWSEGMSLNDCTFASPPVITVDFTKQYSSVGISLVFDTAGGNYCSSLNIKWYQGETLKSEKDFEPDSPLYFCENRVESYNKIVITLNKTSLPFRRAKIQQIIFGLHRTFDMSELRAVSVTNEMSLISDELPVSTLRWTLDSRADVDFMFQIKQPVEIRNGGSLLGVYYIDEAVRSSERVYDIDCRDAFGILDELTFEGGAYLSGKPAKELINEILGEDFTAEYDDNVSDTVLTGILNPSSKREALKQVLFAWGVCASTDGRDNIRVFSLPEDAFEISADRTYTGLKVTTETAVTKVSVTAHRYEEDENGSLELNGIKYSDTQTVYSVINPDVTASDRQKTVEIQGATLVSEKNGQNTAQRVYDFYRKRNTGKAKIVWKGERLGDRLALHNPWGGVNTVHISKMEIKLSNTAAADCEGKGE